MNDHDLTVLISQPKNQNTGTKINRKIEKYKKSDKDRKIGNSGPNQSAYRAPFGDCKKFSKANKIRQKIRPNPDRKQTSVRPKRPFRLLFRFRFGIGSVSVRYRFGKYFAETAKT